MLDALGEWMTQPAYYSVYGDRPARRTGARHASIAPYGPYRVGDGRALYIGGQNDRGWERLCVDVLGQPSLVSDERFRHNPERVAHDGEITRLLKAFLASQSAASAESLLTAAGIACARLRSPAEFFAHPQLHARERWAEVSTPCGAVSALLPPAVLSDAEPAMGAVPSLGSHNESLRAEFGFHE